MVRVTFQMDDDEYKAVVKANQEVNERVLKQHPDLWKKGERPISLSVTVGQYLRYGLMSQGKL